MFGPPGVGKTYTAEAGKSLPLGRHQNLFNRCDVISRGTISSSLVLHECWDAWYNP